MQNAKEGERERKRKKVMKKERKQKVNEKLEVGLSEIPHNTHVFVNLKNISPFFRLLLNLGEENLMLRSIFSQE